MLFGLGYDIDALLLSVAPFFFRRYNMMKGTCYSMRLQNFLAGSLFCFEAMARQNQDSLPH